MPAKTAAAKKRKAKSKVKPPKAAKTAKKTRSAKAKKSAATKRAKTAVKKSPKKSPKKSAKKPAKSAKSAKPSKTAKAKRKAVKKSAAKGRKVKPRKVAKPIKKKPAKKKPAKKKPAKPSKSVKRTAKKIKPKAAPAKAAARPRPRPAAKKLSGGGRAYRPTIKEDYMCKRQRDYFDDVLLRMLNQVSVTAGKTIDAMREAEEALSDENDRASKEAEFVLELREREREGHLARKIRHARQRLRNGEFGLCEECGDNIGLQRLLARPVATLCFECKNLQEYKEKIHS